MKTLLERKKKEEEEEEEEEEVVVPCVQHEERFFHFQPHRITFIANASHDIMPPTITTLYKVSLGTKRDFYL